MTAAKRTDAVPFVAAAALVIVTTAAAAAATAATTTIPTIPTHHRQHSHHPPTFCLSTGFLVPLPLSSWRRAVRAATLVGQLAAIHATVRPV